MSEIPPKATLGYLPLGILFGSLVGVAAYGVTQYPPAMAFGAFFGLIAAIILTRFLPKKP